MRKKAKKAAAAGLCLTCALSFLVFGYWLREEKTENFLTMASYKAEIVEEYETPEHVDPSASVTKKVFVKNEGTVGIFVRVSVTREFGAQKENGSFQKDETLDPSAIEISFNHTFWEEKKDGWFYYKGILKAGETTKEALMESYTLSADTGNEYRGKDARIVVCMESVQAEGGALSVWDMTEKELGVSYQEAPQAEPTGVEFLGQTDGFRIDADGTDLFSAFKNLSPGCARTQKITVKNSSGEQVEILLRAQEKTGQKSGGEQETLLKKLLEKYAVIKITGNKKTLYEGPVCGKAQNASMQKNISLGDFLPGESRELTVSLSLSAEMDNEYEGLTGQVDWIFSAKGEEEAVETNVPKTGDDVQAERWAALAAGAALLCGVSGPGRRRKKRHEIS